MFRRVKQEPRSKSGRLEAYEFKKKYDGGFASLNAISALPSPNTYLELVKDSDFVSNASNLEHADQSCLNAYVPFNDGEDIFFFYLFHFTRKGRSPMTFVSKKVSYVIPAGEVSVSLVSFSPNALRSFHVNFSPHKDSREMLVPPILFNKEDHDWVHHISKVRLINRTLLTMESNELIMSRWILTHLKDVFVPACKWVNKPSSALADLLNEVLPPKYRKWITPGSPTEFYYVAYVISQSQRVPCTFTLRTFIYLILVLYTKAMELDFSEGLPDDSEIRRLLHLSYVGITEGSCNSCLFQQVERIYATGRAYPSPYDLFAGFTRGNVVHMSDTLLSLHFSACEDSGKMRNRYPVMTFGEHAYVGAQKEGPITFCIGRRDDSLMYVDITLRPLRRFVFLQAIHGLYDTLKNT